MRDASSNRAASTARVVSVSTAALCLLWVAAGLLFRDLVYASMPVVAGEALGLADVVELAHFVGLLGLCALALLDGWRSCDRSHPRCFSIASASAWGCSWGTT
jgi:hypothetical protein